MKKFSLMVLVTLLAIGVIGCSDEPAGDNNTDEVIGQADTETNIQVVAEEETTEESAEEPVEETTKEPTEEQETQTNSTLNIGDEVVLGDYSFKITGAEITKDFEDNQVFKIIYSWTNNSEDTTSAYVAFSVKAFQNGVQLDFGYPVESEDNDIKEVRPGSTLDNVEQGFLVDELSPIELEVTELISWSDEKAIYLIDPSTLE